MSSNPVGKNRKAMWQSCVLSILHRLNSEDVRLSTIEGTMKAVSRAADIVLDEMETRFSEPRTQVTLRK